MYIQCNKKYILYEKYNIQSANYQWRYCSFQRAIKKH